MKQITFYILVPLLLLSTAYVNAQEIMDKSPANTPEEFEKQYQRNILKSRINGVYIPKDIDDAIIQLEKLSPIKSLEKFKNAPEDIVAQKLHFGIGRWMIVNWNFYGGSRIEYFLKNMGVGHPDYMADFLIVCFHRHLNGKDLGTKVLSEMYKKKSLEELNKRRVVIDTIKVKK